MMSLKRSLYQGSASSLLHGTSPALASLDRRSISTPIHFSLAGLSPDA
jgi:hypothetical protein